MTLIATTFVALLLTTLHHAASEIVIGLKPLDIPVAAAEEFAGFQVYFEPYEPVPSTEKSCYDYCPCTFTPKEFDTCDCGVKQVCGGEIPVDLDSNSNIAFRWDASSNNAKYITILGNGRIRIEFQGQYDCGDAPGPLYFQTMLGNDIAFEVDFVDQDGNSDENGNSQSFEVRSLFYFTTCTVLLFSDHACVFIDGRSHIWFT
jgi:hypothetical protein